MTNLAADFIATLFLARELTHREHLKTRSYAQHVALAGFYEGVIPLADKFAEAYQGKYGIIEDIPLAENEHAGSIDKVLEKQMEWIEENRDEMTDCRPLQNVIDEVCDLYLSTLYKLKNLD